MSEHDKKAGMPQVRGTMIHRCLLSHAANWWWMQDSERRRDYREACHWMACRLEDQIAARDYDGISMVMSPGSPWWSRNTVEAVQQLTDRDLLDLRTDLAHVVDLAAMAICREAVDDEWRYMQGEASDTLAFLDATGDDRAAARSRVDLLVTRTDKPPLAVDVKTTTTTFQRPRMDQIDWQVAEAYGQRLANSYGREVHTRVLFLDGDGTTRWGSLVRSRPVIDVLAA